MAPCAMELHTKTQIPSVRPYVRGFLFKIGYKFLEWKPMHVSVLASFLFALLRNVISNVNTKY